MDIHSQFFQQLIHRTANFSKMTWLGHPIWQNVLDLWTIQETISELRPALLIETGTWQGGSALFYAHLCELLGAGKVVTVDVEQRSVANHPRLRPIVGRSSTDEEVLKEVHSIVADARGPVMVILDSNHSEDHVYAELKAYSPFVTSGSFLLCQDGVVDILACFAGDRPGPLPAIYRFLREHHTEFQVDLEREQRFLVTHHPMGWLRRL